MKKFIALLTTLLMMTVSLTGALAGGCVDMTVSVELTDELRDALGEAAETIDALLDVLAQMKLHIEGSEVEQGTYAAAALTLGDASLTCEALSEGAQATVVTNLLPGKKIVTAAGNTGFSAEVIQTAMTELMPVVMECANLLSMSQEKVTVQELNAELDAIVITVSVDSVQDIIGKLQSINSANALVQAVSEAAGMLSNTSADVKLTLALDETGMPVYAKAEATKADGAAALTIYTKPENDGRTLVKISGVGFDFARLNTSIRFGLTDDTLSFELDVSIMEANGEFDLLWFDVTAEKQDDGLALSGMLQTTTTETEMTYEYAGTMTKAENDAIHTALEILVSQDSDELATVYVNADASQNETAVDLAAWADYETVDSANMDSIVMEMLMNLLQLLPDDVQGMLIGA